MSLRLLKISLLIQNNGEIIMNFSIPGIETQGFVKVRSCRAKILLVRQQHAEEDMSGKHIRLEFQRLLVVNLGFAETSGLLQIPCDLIMRGGGVRKYL